jgi:pimeloyl-ACP methyl ester carboxylesterase
MIVTSRRDLQSRTRAWLLYPVFAVIALGAVAGAYETIQERLDKSRYDMPGELVDVGGHRLHLVCTGTGSPTVILEAGLGELSVMMMAWIAPDVAKDTQVCAYDRAGRGWSESTTTPQDGVEVATDLHTLMRNAGIAGPYVLAGHSSGGAYVLNFANLYPDEVAGVVLLDSMHPEQYSRLSSWRTFYQRFRRASAVLPSLARVGFMRLLNEFSFGGLPPEQRDVERALWSTARHARSQRDEFSTLRETLGQAGQLKDLGSKPLIVVSAESGALDGWMPLQNDLAALSKNSVHRILSDASHSSLTEDQGDAALSAQAISDLVDSVRASTPLAQ